MSTPYIVSARKYRPSTFQSVVGQKTLTSTLKNAIESQRLAQAYLFCGPRGVGKTSCARIFAKTINCEHRTPEGDACNECESCRAFNEGRSINIVELDAASNNSVNDIRTLNEQVSVLPQMGRYRVFIIDEVHMLSTGAFNAFLKTLEEPPSYVVFILATTEKHKVIPTILSRCQIYDFARITVGDIAEHLSYVAEQEGIEAEPAALGVIARKADGAMRDALSIFDQVAASCRGHITYKGAIDNLNVLDYDYYFRLVDAFLSVDVPQALLIYKEVREAGFDSLQFLQGLASHLRDLMVAATPRTVPLLEVSQDVGDKYLEQAKKINARWAYAAMDLVGTCDLNYRTSANKQFLVELTLIKLCQLLDPERGKVSLPPQPKLRQPEPQTTAQTAQTNQTAQTPAPATPPRPTPAIRPQLHAMPGTMSINAPAPTPTTTPTQTTATPTEPATPQTPAAPVEIDPEKLKTAWNEFISAHPEVPLLISTMRAYPPRWEADSAKVVCYADNPAQQQMFHDNTFLVPHLRDALGVPSLTLKVEIVPESERRVVLTPNEMLKKLTSEDPNIAAILSDLDVELA